MTRKLTTEPDFFFLPSGSEDDLKEIMGKVERLIRYVHAEGESCRISVRLTDKVADDDGLSLSEMIWIDLHRADITLTGAAKVIGMSTAQLSRTLSGRTATGRIGPHIRNLLLAKAKQLYLSERTITALQQLDP